MSPYDGMKLAAALRLLLHTSPGRRRGRHRRDGDDAAEAEGHSDGSGDADAVSMGDQSRWSKPRGALKADIRLRQAIVIAKIE